MSQAEGQSLGFLLIVLMLATLAFWIWICYLIAKSAKKKGRSFAGFFCLSFFLSPILGWIIVLSIAPLRPTSPTIGARELEPDSPFGDIDGVEHFKCPNCAEWIKAEAKICKFCKLDVRDDVKTAREAIAKRQAKRDAEVAQEAQRIKDAEALAGRRLAEQREKEKLHKSAELARLLKSVVSFLRKPIGLISAAALLAAAIGLPILFTSIHQGQAEKAFASDARPEIDFDLSGADYGEEIVIKQPAFEFLDDAFASEPNIKFDYKVLINDYVYQSGSLAYSDNLGRIEVSENTVARIPGNGKSLQAVIEIERTYKEAKTKWTTPIILIKRDFDIVVLPAVGAEKSE